MTWVPHLCLIVYEWYYNTATLNSYGCASHLLILYSHLGTVGVTSARNYWAVEPWRTHWNLLGHQVGIKRLVDVKLASGKIIWLHSPYFPLSSQVLFLNCEKLIGHQMINSTEILKWLREILICRNKFLLKKKVNTLSKHENESTQKMRSFMSHCSVGVCHTGQSHPHQQKGSDQAGGVSLHLPVEPWCRGCLGGHVLLPASLWRGRHPLQCGRAAHAHGPAQLQHLYRACLCQQYNGYRLVVQQSPWQD